MKKDVNVQLQIQSPNQSVHSMETFVLPVQLFVTVVVEKICVHIYQVKIFYIFFFFFLLLSSSSFFFFFLLSSSSSLFFFLLLSSSFFFFFFFFLLLLFLSSSSSFFLKNFVMRDLL